MNIVYCGTYLGMLIRLRQLIFHKHAGNFAVTLPHKQSNVSVYIKMSQMLYNIALHHCPGLRKELY